MTSEIGKQRLLKLADFLDTIPKEKFNYDRWVDDGWKGDKNLSCGTAGCALGWAATMPEFQALGLSLVERLNYSGFKYGEVSLLDEKGDVTDLSPYEAACAVFDLNLEEAEFLFCPGQSLGYETEFMSLSSPGCDATAQEVATHIRAFCEQFR